MTSFAHAEFTKCVRTKRRNLICYFQSSSARSESIYPNDGVSVDTTRVEPLGELNLLYTSYRAEEAVTMQTYRPLETLILPKDFPCGLFPSERTKKVAASKG
ncbi:MAG: hypothetical protein R3282_00155 [Rhodothermales bacterium]|nr:hypothetical protein [Rhodothermales bacterium]